MTAVITNQRKFIVSDAVKHMPIIDKIISAESMDFEERQYWLDILPSMNKEQIERLNNIL